MMTPHPSDRVEGMGFRAMTPRDVQAQYHQLAHFMVPVHQRRQYRLRGLMLLTGLSATVWLSLVNLDYATGYMAGVAFFATVLVGRLYLQRADSQRPSWQTLFSQGMAMYMPVATDTAALAVLEQQLQECHSMTPAKRDRLRYRAVCRWEKAERAALRDDDEQTKGQAYE